MQLNPAEISENIKSRIEGLVGKAKSAFKAATKPVAKSGNSSAQTSRKPR